MSNALVKEVMGTDQDFELYPTTDEILNIFYRHTDKNLSVLDIGAGTGKVLEWFTGGRYAIEKSRPLLDNLPTNVILLGVDFHQNTLIDKSVDVIFCNPPYSEYEHWSERIIKEANANEIYLVIPVRWVNSNAIKEAIKDRNASTKVLGTFSFESSEDRKARATVNLIKIRLGDREKYSYITPFAVFFKERFGEIETEKPHECEVKEQRKKVIKTEIIKSGDLITTLLECYLVDLAKIERNYTAITSLDSDILISFDIDLHKLLKGLEEKMKGLKNLYWRQLFDRFDKVTNRLTSYARRAFLNRIFQNTSVDFTRQNIHAIADWVLRNANLSFEDQILEFYERMLDRVNCKAYKSNKKVFEDQNWGWNDKETIEECGIFVKLSNIIIIKNGIEYRGTWAGERLDMGEDSLIYFRDLTIIANQLGFPVHAELLEEDGITGLNLAEFGCEVRRAEKYSTFFSKNGHPHKLYEVKMFKNGNIHIKFNQNFMNKINVIYGKLKGWISNPQDAKNEMGINIKEAVEHFNYDVPRLDSSDLLQLGVEQ